MTQSALYDEVGGKILKDRISLGLGGSLWQEKVNSPLAMANNLVGKKGSGGSSQL